MTKEEWQKIQAARKLLGLGEQASLKEIKKAYRRASKKYHPDTVTDTVKKNKVTMPDIIDAYETLLAYCNNYIYPLEPAADEVMEAEDWWMDRFGQDPLWGKKS